MTMWFRALLWSCCFAALFGCRQKENRTVIARVGRSELTLEDVKSRLDTTQGLTTDQVQRYLARWVSDELLFQEARRRGLDRSDEIDRQMIDVQRQLAVHNYLDRTLQADSTALTDQAMHAYYDQHAPEFVVQEDMVKLNLAAFSSREQASAFAAFVSQGKTWDTVFQSAMRDTGVSSKIIAHSAGQMFTAHTLYPSELWRVVGTLNPGDVSFPVKTALGYYVLQPVAVMKKGKIADFDLARDDVLQRLLIDQRRKNYDNLIGTLRKRYTVEILLGPTRQIDTTTNEHHE